MGETNAMRAKAPLPLCTSTERTRGGGIMRLGRHGGCSAAALGVSSSPHSGMDAQGVIMCTKTSGCSETNIPPNTPVTQDKSYASMVAAPKTIMCSETDVPPVTPVTPDTSMLAAPKTTVPPSPLPARKVKQESALDVLLIKRQRELTRLYTRRHLLDDEFGRMHKATQARELQLQECISDQKQSLPGDDGKELQKQRQALEQQQAADMARLRALLSESRALDADIYHVAYLPTGVWRNGCWETAACSLAHAAFEKSRRAAAVQIGDYWRVSAGRLLAYA